MKHHQYTGKELRALCLKHGLSGKGAQSHCPFCSRIHDLKFRDELSAREYCVSGLCQFCQDQTFGTTDAH